MVYFQDNCESLELNLLSQLKELAYRTLENTNQGSKSYMLVKEVI